MTTGIHELTATQKGCPMNDNNSYGNNPYNNNAPHNNDPYAGGPYNGNPYQNSNFRRCPGGASGERLASAAMVMGILALATFVSMTIYPPFIFGSIAIVLALLSKGRAPRMLSKAKAGIICAAIGLTANCALCGTSLYMLYTNPEILEQVNDIFEDQYGMSYEDMLETILKDSGQE